MVGLSELKEIRDPEERVRALCQYGCQVDVDFKIPANRYLRSGKEMIRMAEVYLREKDVESAFVLYSKFLTLFIEKLPKHPGYRELTPDSLKKNKADLNNVFGIADILKPKILKKYQVEESLRREKEVEESKLLAEKKAREREEQARVDAENLARIERYDSELRADEERRFEQFRRAEIQRRQQQQQQRQKQYQEDSTNNFSSSSVSSIPPADGSMRQLNDQVSALAIQDDNSYIAPPSFDEALRESYGKPLIPDRSSKPIAATEGSQIAVTPTNHLDFHHASVAPHVTNKYGFRTIVIPHDLVSVFITLSAANSAKNIETCGVLCGQLAKGDSFSISHLIIPKQKGTADSCTTLAEEELFVHQDELDLITLGWIHTHPSQTVFLSSVDLHTHLCYQLMLPEAIAIVHSVKCNDTGVLQLTPSHGLSVLKGCSKDGFHPHPNIPPLFEEAQHVMYDKFKSIQTIDLRNV